MASFFWDIKSGGKGGGRTHANYIARVGHHADREDMIGQGHGNLPDWAQGSAATFWGMADQHERSNGAVYREIVVALPNELTDQQNVELAKDYAQNLAGIKPFQFAVHCPVAALGGVPQPHAHIMISDRVPDHIPRSAREHFRRYNPAHPELGGCKKDSGGKTRAALAAEVKAKRADWAETVNATLEHYGHGARVDPRSNLERGLPPPTERHLGPARIRAFGAQDKAELIASRTKKSRGKA